MLTLASTIWVSCVAGAAAGVLGLTKLQGFAVYALAALLQLLVLLCRYRFSVQGYFVSLSPLWKEGLTTGMSVRSPSLLARCYLLSRRPSRGTADGRQSFVLMWTLVYNIVHVY